MRPADDAVAEFIRSEFRAMPQIFVKEFVQFGIRNDTGETVNVPSFAIC